jgi:hypothetical protein
MITTKNRAALAVTAGVWAVALGAAAVLMYDLNRPLGWEGAGAHFTTPFVSALVAGGWLALISAFLLWRRKVQIGREYELAYPRGTGKLFGRGSRRQQPEGPR